METCKIKFVKKGTGVIFLFQLFEFFPVKDMAILNRFIKVNEEKIFLLVKKVVCNDKK